MSQLKSSKDDKDTHTHIHLCIYSREWTSCSYLIYNLFSRPWQLICFATLLLDTLAAKTSTECHNKLNECFHAQLHRKTLACLYVCIWTSLAFAEGNQFAVTDQSPPQLFHLFLSGTDACAHASSPHSLWDWFCLPFSFLHSAFLFFCPWFVSPACSAFSAFPILFFLPLPSSSLLLLTSSSVFVVGVSSSCFGTCLISSKTYTCMLYPIYPLISIF